MRTVVSLLLLLVAALGAGEAWAAHAPDSAPMTETHAPAEVEIEVEVEAKNAPVAAVADTRGGATGLASSSDASGLARGVPPTPPPER